MITRKAARARQKQEEAVGRSSHARSTAPAVRRGQASRRTVVAPTVRQDQASRRTAVASTVSQGRSSRRVAAGGASNQLKWFTETTVNDATKILGRDFHYSKIKISEFGNLQLTADTLDQLANQLARSLRVTDLTAWCEANSRKILDAVLETSVDEVNQRHGYDMKLVMEHFVAGDTHKGHVDMAVKLGEAIVLVVEAKKDDLNLGAAQNFLQILAARQQNIRRGVNMGDTMYGLVSTGFKSMLLRVVFKENGHFVLTRSRIIIFPTKKTSTSEQVLRERTDSLSGKTMWVIDNQANLLHSTP
jgi:hypothetical protein